MDLAPRVELIPEKKMAGRKVITSMIENKVVELWMSFMPLKKRISNAVDQLLYSIEIYPNDYFDDLDPSQVFEKWAAVEVTDFNEVPSELEIMILPQGLYAVFHYCGHPSKATATFEYIFLEWLPNSPYKLDYRPHLEVMGEKYKNNNDDSEEDFWIPIKEK